MRKLTRRLSRFMLPDGTLPPLQGGEPTVEERRARYDEARTAAEAASQAISDLPSEATDEERQAAQAAYDEAIALVRRLRQQEERIRELDEAERNAPITPTEDTTDHEERGDGDVRVTRDETVYRMHGPHSFVRDLLAQRDGDPAAAARLQRNAREVVDGLGAEYRDVGTGAFGALVVPQYLTDLVAPYLRGGRPFLDSINRLPLPPDGMTLNIPRITTATAVAAQAAENDAFQETNIDETTLAVSVRTYAGQQDVSIQALERGTMTEEIVFQDLASDYAAKTDAAAIGADGTSGTHLGVLSTSGINAITYTDASPTAAELWPKVHDAIQQVSNVQGKRANLIVMHPRRWAWLASQSDSQGRPLVLPVGDPRFNAQGAFEAGSYGELVGTLAGIPVVTDANIPTNLGAGTNEDRIIVCDRNLVHVFEEGDGTPLLVRLEQTVGPATVRLAVRGYQAFTAGRFPTAVSVISGTGCAAPTF